MLETDYYNALEYGQKIFLIMYKQKLSEMNIGPYNTVILMLLKSNINILFITSAFQSELHSTVA